MNKELLVKLSQITAEEQKLLSGGQVDADIYTQDGEFVIASQKLLEKGRLIDVRPHTRFAHFPRHRHNYIEVIYMYSGSTTHLINGQKIVLGEGDLLFLNTHAEQEVLPANHGDIAINFIILPEFFEHSFVMLESEKSPLNEFLMSCLFKSATSYNYLYFKVAEVLPIQNLVENLIWSISNNYPNKRSIQQKTMALLFLQLMNHTDKIQRSNSDFKDGFIVTVLKYIEEHYQDGSLTELAGLLNFDFHWLSKEIKKQTSKTFKELLKEKKLRQASYLLKQTQLPVEEIIGQVGYENTSFFYRIFKAHYGMSPKKYREQQKSA